VTCRDIRIAEAIFGPDVGSLKRKTVRQSPDAVNAPIIMGISAGIYNHYPGLVLADNVMYVNKIPFFMTISRHIQFGTAEVLTNETAKTLTDCIKKVKALYVERGFRIQTICMDGQFECLRADLADMQINLNTSSTDKHVPEIEKW
jgi:uncharacterized protein (DUF1786 family)